MAKFKQECIFGIRAVMEAIQDEKEIDKVMFRQGIKGELFQQLFSLVRDDINDLPIIYNISWYEQKAVIVLLALLSLGVSEHRQELRPERPGL